MPPGGPSAHIEGLLSRLPASLGEVLAATRAMEYRGDLSNAERVLKVALGRCEARELRSALGTLYIKQRRHREALIALMPVLRATPHDAPTLLLVCECLIESGEFQRARGMLERAAQVGAAAPRVENLRQLLARRQREASTGASPGDPVLDASDSSLSMTRPVRASDIPMADDAHTLSDFNDDPTEALVFGEDLMRALQGADPVAALDAARVQQEIAPTRATAFEDNELPTMAASPDEFAAAFDLDDEPTTDYSAHARKLRQQATAALYETAQGDYHDPTRALELDVPTSALGQHESDAISAGLMRTAVTPPGFEPPSSPPAGLEAPHDPTIEVQPPPQHVYEPLRTSQNLGSTSVTSPPPSFGKGNFGEAQGQPPRTPQPSTPQRELGRTRSAPHQELGRTRSAPDEIPFPELNTPPNAPSSPSAVNLGAPPTPQAPQAPAQASVSFLGDRQRAAQFAMLERDLDEGDPSASDLQVGIFANPPQDLFSLSGDDLEEASDAPSFGARPAIGPDPGTRQPYQQPMTPAPNFGATPAHGFTPHAGPPRHAGPPQQPAGGPRPHPRQKQGRTFSDDSLQLDYEELSQVQKQPIPPEQQVGKNRAAPRDDAGERGGGKGRLVLIVGALLIVTLSVVGFGTLYAADSALREQIDADVQAATQLAAADSLPEYKKAHASLAQSLERASFLGADFDRVMLDSLTLPGMKARASERRAVGQLAALSAILEYRYGQDFGAKKHLERATSQLGAAHPDVLHAEAYAAMARAPQEALLIASNGRAKHPGHIGLVEAHVRALLAMSYHEQAWEQAATLRELPTPTQRQRLLTALAALSAAREEASVEAQKLLDAAEGVEHPEGRAALLRATLFAREETKNIEQQLRAITEASAKYSPCQIGAAYAALGDARLIDGDLSAARISHTRAVEACPSSPELATHHLHTLVLAGRHEEARAQLERAREQAPTSLLKLAEGELALSLGDPAAATEALAKAPDTHPRKHWLLGQAALLDGRPEDAITHFERSGELDAFHGRAEAWSQLARLHAAPARAAELSKTIDALVSKNDRDVWLLRASAQALMTQARRAEAKKERADLFAQAYKRLSRAVAITPYDATTHYELCSLQVARRRVDSAIDDCKTGHELNPTYVPGALSYARLLLDRGDTDDAVELLGELDEALESNFAVSEMFTRALIIAGDLKAAREELDGWSSASDGPHGARIALLEGLHAFNAGEYVEANAHLKHAVELDGDSIEARVFLAYAQIRLGELDAAEAPLKEHLSDDDWGAYAWLALGELRRRQKRFSDAEENLEKAASKLKDTMTPPWFITEAYLQRALAWQDHKGWSNKRVGRYLELAAERGTERHVNLNYVRALHALGQRRPDRDAAERYLEAALAIQPEHCPTLKSLAYVLERNGGDADRVEDLEGAFAKHCDED